MALSEHEMIPCCSLLDAKSATFRCQVWTLAGFLDVILFEGKLSVNLFVKLTFKVGIFFLLLSKLEETARIGRNEKRT